MLKGIYNLFLGLLVTIKNFFSPRVTLQYPSERAQMSPRFRGAVKIDLNRCITCGMCVRACPNNCLSLTVKPLEEGKRMINSFTYNMETCLFCRLCVEPCPVSCVSMDNKEYEWSAYDRKPFIIDYTCEYGKVVKSK